MNFLNKIKSGLSKTREQVFGQIQDVIFAARKVDDELLEEIEDLLIAGDVGVETTGEIIDRLQTQVRRKNFETTFELYHMLKKVISEMFVEPGENPLQTEAKPHVVLVVGVNGSGKTTSIAKIAAQYKEAGKDVLLVAGDTFRAAAIDQLQIWADRVDVEMIKHKSGADPGAVTFDALQAARSRSKDVVIIDTAGRLHTQVNLMEELKKVRRVIQKTNANAPHETLLVLDATVGQNAINQALQFIDAVSVTGIVLTKLDGTAKGGAVIGISHELKLPVKFVGLGEKIDDLQPFDPALFVEGLFKS